MRFEFTDSEDLYCDISEIYSKINAKQDKISDLDAIDSYTKAEADARFTLISLYEAKIAKLEERIKALEDRQTTTEPTQEQ